MAQKVHVLRSQSREEIGEKSRRERRPTTFAQGLGDLGDENLNPRAVG